MQIRFVIRSLSWVALGLLAAEFWVPQAWLAALHLTGRNIQLGLCAAVVLCLIEAYGFQDTPDRFEHYGPHYNPRALRWNKMKLGVLRLTAAFLAYAAILEIGQVYFGRHAAIEDFLTNSAAVLVAITVLLAVHRWVKRELPDAEP